MKQRMTASVRLASVLVVVVMAAALALTVTRDRDARFVESTAWSLGFGDVQSLQVIDLDADGADDLFVQSTALLIVYAAGGGELWRRSLSPPATATMGDVDGDGTEEVVTFEANGLVEVTSAGAVRWSKTVDGMGAPARAAVIRFRAGTQVVLGDADGRMVGLSAADGAERWRGAFPGGDAVRGLDDVVFDGERLLAAADRGGAVQVSGADGRSAWSTEIQGLRRMRSFDTDGDGRGEVFFGGEQGVVHAMNADGSDRWEARIGQQVIEIREGELDGDPTSREIVVGGRDGGVFALDTNGGTLWATAVGSRVADVVTLDIDDDGADETLVGDEGGGLTVFAGRSGERFNLDSRSGAVTALEVGRLTASDQVVVSAGNGIAVLDLVRQEAPLAYSPLVAGLVLSLAIAGVALFLGGLPEALPTEVTVTDKSAEGLLARRRMLHENIADVEELRAQGEIEGSAALAKLEDLRRQLADADRELRLQGVNVTLESMKCPNCGGRVRLGADRCDYCGEVVIA